jgi:sensor histidine kinase YesM
MKPSTIARQRTIYQFSHKSALRFSFRACLLFNATIFFGFLYSERFVLYKDVILPGIFIIACNLVLFYILFVINFRIIQLNWSYLKRTIVSIPGSLLIAVVFSIVTTKIQLLILGRYDESIIWINLGKDIFSVLIVQITSLLVLLTISQQEAAVDRERLIAENLRVRYEVLKSQVNPHFVFNSLNTLDGLIGIHDEGAHEYLQSFSSVFRYVLNNKEITRLSDELSFTDSYCTMLKIRYGDNFSMEYHIDEKYKTWFIMPISLQLLVENAVKHNVISKHTPLKVIIETTNDDFIRVWNVINLKKDAEHGEGIGLANLADRYRLLFQKEIVIKQHETFCVEIPLIERLEPGITNQVEPARA